MNGQPVCLVPLYHSGIEGRWFCGLQRVPVQWEMSLLPGIAAECRGAPGNDPLPPRKNSHSSRKASTSPPPTESCGAPRNEPLPPSKSSRRTTLPSARAYNMYGWSLPYYISVGHFGNKLHAHKPYLLLRIIVAQFVHRLVQVIRFRFFEVVVDVEHVILVHDLVQEVVDVQFST